MLLQMLLNSDNEQASRLFGAFVLKVTKLVYAVPPRYRGRASIANELWNTRRTRKLGGRIEGDRDDENEIDDDEVRLE